MEALVVILLLYGVIWLIALGVAVLQYVLMSLGLQSIAKRRGIRNPWLAWIPVGNAWLLGCISDQYQYVAKGVHRSRRKLLVGLTVAALVFSVVYFILAFFMTEAETTAGIFVVLAYVLLLAGLYIWNTVLTYMAMYDLFVSTEPKNAVLYLVLSIFLGGIANALLIFICRDKDDGMPPRRFDPLPDTVIVHQETE